MIRHVTEELWLTPEQQTGIRPGNEWIGISTHTEQVY